MARIVGYFEDFETPEREAEAFSEGPFVLVNARGWRIEVQSEGSKCPVLPDLSIYKLKEELGWPVGKTDDRDLAERVCDDLNRMVREGDIVKDDNGTWRRA